jgi:hypothetical protein
MSYALILRIKRELRTRLICAFDKFTYDFYLQTHSMMSKKSCRFSEQVSEYLSLYEKRCGVEIYK